ncbi:MAG: hypothetical protein M3066_03010 [Actinomycetota bacterium]|nr:hypothetical protein [Actinomycetota bacterium]
MSEPPPRCSFTSRGWASLAARLPEQPLPFVVLDYPVIVVARRPSPLRSRSAWPTGSPLDIERAATLTTEELPARVRDVRASGTLTDVDQLLAEPGG